MAFQLGAFQVGTFQVTGVALPADTGAFGEEWARLYPIKPKRKKRAPDARGIPPEWKAPAPPAVPAEFVARDPLETLRDLAAGPPRAVPPEWAEDDDDIELLLLV